MNTLEYIVNKFQLDLNQKSPITIEKINRQIMAETLAELGFRSGAEIGVAQGEHAETLCKANPGALLYCVDPYEHYRGYNDYLDKTLKRFKGEAHERLKAYKCIFLETYSMTAVGSFPDKALDFVYIDGAHNLRAVVDDIWEWTKKVRTGGIVFGHDYKRPAKNIDQHVVDAVNAYTYSQHIVPWFVLGQQGKHDNLYREGTRAWMFVKM